MEKKKITVIVPTYNREETLKKCLKALCSQEYPRPDYEILVVDDGSSDGTGAYAAALGKDLPVELRYLRQENKGPAAARNLGVKSARGEIVLFIGDDIIADPRLLAEHAAWHEAHPGNEAAVLGYTTWSQEIKITPFMSWLESSGVQFAYGGLTDAAEADPGLYFYTSNISLKKSFLLANGLFDEEFRYAAYEDIELGLRLKSKGLRLYYNKSAVGWHEHATSLKDACARMIKVGESGALLKKKTGKRQDAPEATAPLWLRAARAVKFRVYSRLAAFYETRAVKDGLFRYMIEYFSRIGAERYRERDK